MVRLIAIVAMTPDRVIGRANALPRTSIEGDLPRFKELTMGQAIIMGRKTYESIGGPLPGRRNIVMSRKASDDTSVERYTSIQDLMDAIQSVDQAWIIGGAKIYDIFLPHTDEIYLTITKKTYHGDTYLPVFESDFQELSRQEHSDHYFIHYTRLGNTNISS